eukprot:1793740-Rhodomonas_salina.2
MSPGGTKRASELCSLHSKGSMLCLVRKAGPKEFDSGTGMCLLIKYRQPHSMDRTRWYLVFGFGYKRAHSRE